MALLDSIHDLIGGHEGTYEGISYRLFGGSSATVVQTPTLWGTEPDDTSYYTHGNWPGQNLTTAITEVVATARTLVDVTTLWPLPDGHFLDAIREGLLQRQHPDPLVLRIHAGLHPGTASIVHGMEGLIRTFIGELSRGLDQTRVTIGVSVAMVSNLYQSWNHGKLVAADGARILFGGHNMWAATYLDYAPVHDASVDMSGPAAGLAHIFCDQLWAFVEDWYRAVRPTARVWSFVWSSTDQRVSSGIPARPPLRTADPSGPDRAMPVVRLGVGLVAPATDGTDQASDHAKVAAVESATTVVRISQQDLAFSIPKVPPALTGWISGPDPRVFAAIARALDRGVIVQVVVSGAGATSAVWDPYSMLGGQRTREALVDFVREAVLPARADAAIGRLQVKEIHTVLDDFAPWSGGNGRHVMANHAKVYIVDDEVAYVGSDNLYPCRLQEFGVLMEGQPVVRLLADYWQPLWNNGHAV